MPVTTLYCLSGSPPCNFVRSLAKHLNVELTLKCVDFSKMEHFADDYLKRPLFCGSTKATEEEVSDFEQNALKGFEHLVGDDKFAIGDKLTLADLSLISNLAIALENTFVDSAKFPKLASYYERVKSELPYFEEIYRPAIAFLQQHWAEVE
ncbi:hypothetical protein V5799_018901 [Amblyomma americanum]|uniref:GST C-terminal domain-containing protein n=1 Tax=Amblyomma americanum TaxID=6943 RepID=A0AAQ4EYD0_AMBAM